MATVLHHTPIRTLHAVVRGETVRIRTILFERLRADCARLGLWPGQRLRCRAAGPRWLILLTDAGRRILLERDWARFVEVEAAAAPPDAAAGPEAASYSAPSRGRKR